MSKSIGNVTDPLTVIEGGQDQKAQPPYGADVLRLWAASVDFASDVLVGPKILEQVCSWPGWGNGSAGLSSQRAASCGMQRAQGGRGAAGTDVLRPWAAPVEVLAGPKILEQARPGLGKGLQSSSSGGGLAPGSARALCTCARNCMARVPDAAAPV